MLNIKFQKGLIREIEEERIERREECKRRKLAQFELLVDHVIKYNMSVYEIMRFPIGKKERVQALRHIYGTLQKQSNRSGNVRHDLLNIIKEFEQYG